jgi:hypothetical protein
VGRQVAVLVNRHAQGVTERHLDELRRIVGERVYITNTIAEGTAAIRRSSTRVSVHSRSRVSTAGRGGCRRDREARADAGARRRRVNRSGRRRLPDLGRLGSCMPPRPPLAHGVRNARRESTPLPFTVGSTVARRGYRSIGQRRLRQNPGSRLVCAIASNRISVSNSRYTIA